MTADSTPLIQWDDALNLGDETIDRQHRGLVELINQMHAHLHAPDMEVQIMRCITSMYLYAKEHFWDEEALMDRIGYPDKERHAALHREFVQKTHDMTDCCLTDELHYSQLLNFLVSWFNDHVSTEDAKLVAFAKAAQA